MLAPFAFLLAAHDAPDPLARMAEAMKGHHAVSFTVATGPARTERLGERDATAVPPGSPTATRTLLLLDPATALPVGTRIERGNKLEDAIRFQDVVLDPPLTPADFAYAPPVDYRDSAARVEAGQAGTRTMVGPPLAQVLVGPGVWTTLGKGADLRLMPKPRLVGRDWVFTIEAKTADAYLWKQASTTARVGAWSAPARRVLFDPKTRRATVVVPRHGAASAPEVLFFEALRKDRKAEFVFHFEFKPGAGR